MTPEQRWAEYRRASYDVLVDFDGTISQFAYPELGPPIPGAQDFIKALIADGLKPVVWSSRFSKRNASHAEAKQTYVRIANWLKMYNFPPLEIDMGTNGKRLALAYVDDRGVGFRGDYADSLAQVRAMHEKEDVKRARALGVGHGGAGT